VALGDPSPWSHLAAHSLVWTTWEALGRALPKHAAWQLTSPASQAMAHCTADERPEGIGAEETAALVMSAAMAPAAKRRTAEYFMVSLGCVWRKISMVSSN
jgi:hypothetical protein